MHLAHHIKGSMTLNVKNLFYKRKQSLFSLLLNALIH